MSDLNIDYLMENDILWIRLNESEASIKISGTLGKRFEKYLSLGAKGIALDMSEVDFIDSSFLGTLIAILKEAEGKGIKFIIFGLSPNVMTIFNLTRLDKIIDIFPDREAANASFTE